MSFRFTLNKGACLLFASVVLTQTSALAAKKGDPIPGQFIITVSDETTPEEVISEHKVKHRFMYRKGMRGFAGKLSQEMHERLKRDRRVLHIEQDRVIQVDLTQSSAPWGLSRIDQRSLPLDSVYTYNYTGSGITAYIVDTGIRYDHQEFGGRAVQGFDAFGGNGSDCAGHGTHVAGTVGGRNYGVAKNVRLVSVRVLDCNGSGSTSTVMAGLDWIRQNRKGPSVANLSIGGGASSSLDTALNNLINSGVPVAVAAGNENKDACTTSPARVPAAMTVGASDSRDNRASFSNYGNCVDWFAPGVGIASAGISSSSAIVSMSGTSMAAPHTAGAIALLLEKNPSMTPAAIRSALFEMSTKQAIFSSNSLNNHLLYAVEAASTAPAPTPAPAPAPAPTPAPTTDVLQPSIQITSPTQGSYVPRYTTVAIRNTATDNVKVSKVEVRVNGVLKCTLTVAPYTCNWRVPYTRGVSYDLQSKAYDTSGNTRSSSMVRVISR